MPARRSLLVLDDDHVFARALRRELRSDFEVELTTSLVEAQEAVEQIKPNVGLFDLFDESHNATGLALVEFARRTSPSTVPLVMSAQPTIELTVLAMRRGAADVLQKPISMSILNHACEEWRKGLYDIESMQWVHIHRVLAAQAGNLTRAAKQLGCSRQGLRKMLDRIPPKFIAQRTLTRAQ